MSKRIDKRISEIKGERVELLKMVKNNLADSGSLFSSYLDSVIKALVIDEKSTKKYCAYVDAQNMIVSLLQDMSEAKTKEEVVALRKRINYYINKIKEEIKKRNIDSTTLEAYQEEASKVRGQITKAVRILKRESNLELIDSLYSRIEELNQEELIALKKALDREKSFNTNFLKPPKKKTIKTPQDEFSKRLSRELDMILRAHHQDAEEEDRAPQPVNPPAKSVVLGIEGKEEATETPKDTNFLLNLDELLTRVQSEPRQSSHTYIKVGDLDFEEAKAYIVESAESYIRKYDIRETRDYNDKKINNFASLLLNIPNIIHNKRSIRRMKKDYCNFYRGDDLAGAIEYQKGRNSMRQALRCIFSRSHLRSEEAENLKKHDNCAKWLYDFFKSNSMTIPVSKGYQLH